MKMKGFVQSSLFLVLLLGCVSAGEKPSEKPSEIPTSLEEEEI